MFKAKLKLNMTAKVIAKSNKDEFEAELQKLLEAGFKIVSCNCGFINSELYDFADYYQAVLVKDEGVTTHKIEGD